MFQLEDHYWWFVARRTLALALLDRFAPDVERPVLDLGCGTGAVLQQIQRRREAIGFDFSEEALRFCRQRGLAPLVQGDAHALPFARGSLGAIVGLDLFEHLEDDELAFRESARCLRPGGVLILSVPAFRFLWGPHDVALMHFRRYRAAEVRRKLTAAGLEPVLVSYSVFALFPVVACIRAVEKLRRGPAKASLPALSAPMNRMLITLQRAEQRMLMRVPLPWGSSVVAVARKPSA